jgi:hypothetical protein
MIDLTIEVFAFVFGLKMAVLNITAGDRTLQRCFSSEIAGAEYNSRSLNSLPSFFG